MEKEFLTTLKLQLPGGYVTPAPPVGPALGQHGVNIGQFCYQFNERTQELNGADVSVVITVYNDKSFSFIIKQPTAVYLLKQAAEISRGSGQPNKDVAGFITREQLERIAETKMPDLNTKSLEAAMRIIAGTARSMGIKIVLS
ncbi:50S ribosomal protein L11 [Parcubacteria bacterium DG_72]|nr:MAG: 50S ribosomal protein L11 [Parcubacteria bacterium DG_72]